MDLSQASERQQSPASEGMKHKSKEFKRLALSSSFGPQKRQKRKVSRQRLTSHLIYTTASIHHPWQSKSPSFHSPKEGEFVMRRGLLKKKVVFISSLRENFQTTCCIPFELHNLSDFLWNLKQPLWHITMCSISLICTELLFQAQIQLSVGIYKNMGANTQTQTWDSSQVSEPGLHTRWWRMRVVRQEELTK